MLKHIESVLLFFSGQFQCNDFYLVFVSKSLSLMNQVLTMSTVLMFPLSKAMALGGVATGSMNAYEHTTDTGSIRNRGFTPIEVA